MPHMGRHAASHTLELIRGWGERITVTTGDFPRRPLGNSFFRSSQRQRSGAVDACRSRPLPGGAVATSLRSPSPHVRRFTAEIPSCARRPIAVASNGTTAAAYISGCRIELRSEKGGQAARTASREAGATAPEGAHP